MKQWFAIVLGTAVMLVCALLFGERAQGDSAAAGISGFSPSQHHQAASDPLSLSDGWTPEVLTAVLSPETGRKSLDLEADSSGVNRFRPAASTCCHRMLVARVQGFDSPDPHHLDESGSPAQEADTTTEKEVSAASTAQPELVTREHLEDIVREYFPGDEYDYAAAVVACESSWNPDAIWTGAKNKTPQTKSAAGLFQFIQRTWLWVAEDAGVDPDPAARLDPLQATQAARFLVDRAGGGWSHWECAP